MKSRKPRRTIQELVTEIAETQIEQDRQIDLGNARAGNAAARRGIRAFEELRDVYGDAGREALTTLFEHPNDSVRSLAAAYLLRYCTDRSLSVLRELLKSGKGFSPMEAFYCIKNWEEGTWQLDPAPEDSTKKQDDSQDRH